MALHPYERSPHSSAGNCVCGMDYESRAHPHPYTQAYRSELCVCAHSAGHAIHADAATAQPTPVDPSPASNGLRGTAAAREAIHQARGHDAAPQTPILFAGPDTTEEPAR
jgi:hypothetical protein